MLGFYYNDAKITGIENVESLVDCQALCQNLPECAYWNYRKSDGKCGLRGRDVKELTEFTGIVSSTRYCPSKLCEQACAFFL